MGGGLKVTPNYSLSCDTGLNKAGDLARLLKAKGPATEGPAEKKFLAKAVEAMKKREADQTALG